ncbi:protein sneaky-like isoform X2 [Bacillus rossius redtenbacheri]|uniref:protein sneaky-like isoform X2 n=1 Tax=Bacillus rossius redtenbacheri TaxID=93214 RepID=UPI002FDE2469
MSLTCLKIYERIVWCLHYMVIVDLQFSPLVRLGLGTLICLLIGLGNALSIQVRCLTLLTVPSLCGSTGRAVLKAAVLSMLVSGPINNMAANGREVARVFCCSVSLTFNLTKNRFDMMFRPFQQAILSLKGDASEVKAAANEVKDASLPITSEVEGEEEMQKIKEDNDYLDELHSDTKRSEEIAQRNQIAAADSREVRVEKKYRQKLEQKCEGILTKGAESCRKAFSDAYGTCYNKVTWVAAWLLCWPMKLTFVCNIWQAIGGARTCDVSKVIDPGFGGSYGSLKSYGDSISGQLAGVRVQYQVVKLPPVINVRQTVDTAHDIMKEFEAKKQIMDVLLVYVKRLLAFFFIKIILASQGYHDSYLDDVEFDNVYVTAMFRRMDARRHLQGRHALLPFRKAERVRFVDPFAVWPSSKESGRVGRHSMQLLLELVAATSVVLMDHIFYVALDLVRLHGALEYRQEGHHDIRLVVQGTGMIAKLVKSVLHGFNIKRRIKTASSNEACLPQPSKVGVSELCAIYGVFLLSWLLILLEAYTQRLRRGICAYFYPEREKRRVRYMYNEALKRRRGFFKFAKNRIQKLVREQRLEMDANVLMVLQLRYPRYFSWLRVFSVARQKCVVCGELEPLRAAEGRRYLRCGNPLCFFKHCPECWRDMQAVCHACAEPASEDNATEPPGHTDTE